MYMYRAGEANGPTAVSGRHEYRVLHRKGEQGVAVWRGLMTQAAGVGRECMWAYVRPSGRICDWPRSCQESGVWRDTELAKQGRLYSCLGSPRCTLCKVTRVG